MRHDLGTGKTTELSRDVLDWSLSADLYTMVLLLDEEGESRVRVFEAGAKPADEDDDEEEIDLEEPGAASGLVDVEGRVVLRAGGPCEWRQMFGDGWAATLRQVSTANSFGCKCCKCCHLSSDLSIYIYMAGAP